MLWCLTIQYAPSFPSLKQCYGLEVSIAILSQLAVASPDIGILRAWLQDWDQPQHIPDRDAKKPEDWDDDIDGEWEAPMIDNPEYKVYISILKVKRSYWRFSVTQVQPFQNQAVSGSLRHLLFDYLLSENPCIIIIFLQLAVTQPVPPSK